MCIRDRTTVRSPSIQRVAAGPKGARVSFREDMWKSSSVSPPTHTAARNQAGLAARPPGHPGEGSARRVGPGSRQAALKSGVTAPPVGWALPSRARDPRTAPRAPDGRFLINSRDSPEPGSGREPGEPPRRSAAGCVRKRPWLESSGPGDRRPHASSEVVQPLGAITAVSYTHLRAHETVLDLVCRLLLE